MPFINSSFNVHYFKKPIFSLVTYFSVSETLFQSSISKCLLICLSSHITILKAHFSIAHNIIHLVGIWIQDQSGIQVVRSTSPVSCFQMLFKNRTKSSVFGSFILHSVISKPDRLKSGFQLFSDFGCLVFESPTNCIFKPVLTQYRVPQ